MRLVLTHEHPDFDALASVALATLLYPGAVGVIAGQLETNVAELLRLYRDQIPLVPAESVKPEDVTALVVVDTADPRRLGRFTELSQRVSVTVYDHHPASRHTLGITAGVREQVGATVTLLCRELELANTPVPASLATLALLGLHEDTGDLTFDHTTSADHRAAAYLLQHGANLEMVRRFRSPGTGSEHFAIRDALVAGAEVVEVRGRRVAMATLESQPYAPGMGTLAGDLLSASGCDAALVIARMDGRTLVFARANTHIDVAQALHRALDGGGHARAAFARTQLAPREARDRIVDALPDCTEAPLRARDIMSAPVLTVNAAARVAEARARLAEHAHNGMPVVDDREQVVGVISRRDLDHALRHNLADAPVASFMTRPAISAGPDATVAELERLVLAHNIGRVPIVEQNELVGIVTRSDLIAAHHPPAPLVDVAARLLAALPSGARQVMALAATAVGNGRMYLVGGALRDSLLGLAVSDLDFVLEGVPSERVAHALQAAMGGSLTLHPTFGTASLELDAGLTIDLAQARAEAYAHPGALPDVRSGDLRADLARRDFSINAMALRVAPEPVALLDPFHGLQDLDARLLRVLHPLSFIEDPTRLVRGARLAGRLGLRFDSDTRAKADAALQPHAQLRVSAQRLRAELTLTLQEPRVAPPLQQLHDLGALANLYGLGFDAQALERFDSHKLEHTRRTLASNDATDNAHAALLLLLCLTPDAQAERAVARFHWPQRLLQQRTKALALQRGEVLASDHAFAALDAPSRRALVALAPALAQAVRAFEFAAPEPKVRGRDVLALGLAPGAAVGDVLARIDAARAAGIVRGFEQERALAKRLVDEHHAHANAKTKGPKGSA